MQVFIRTSVFYLTLPFIYLLSVLPFGILYGISDLSFLLLFYVFRYRRKVVQENLKKAFPEKSDKERNLIERRFYRFFSDLLLETFKTLTISKAEMLRRCRITPESATLLQQLGADGSSVILVLGHFGNWEWGGNAFSLSAPHQLYVIYHPLSNPLFDRLVYRMRSRFGSRLIAMNDTFREMLRHRNELTATAFIADQSPDPKHAYWTPFLNQDTPVFPGTEKLARKLNRKVLYVSVVRLKRGFYELRVDPNIWQAVNFDEQALTAAHTRRLEADILAQPETWLWTHKRWKHQRN